MQHLVAASKDIECKDSKKLCQKVGEREQSRSIEEIRRQTDHWENESQINTFERRIWQEYWQLLHWIVVEWTGQQEEHQNHWQ